MDTPCDRGEVRRETSRLCDRPSGRDDERRERACEEARENAHGDRLVEDSGNMLGVATSGFGTYTSAIRPDGSVYGEGEGGMTTPDGEMITWKGSGLGKLGPGGASATAACCTTGPLRRSSRL